MFHLGHLPLRLAQRVGIVVNYSMDCLLAPEYLCNFKESARNLDALDRTLNAKGGGGTVYDMRGSYIHHAPPRLILCLSE